MTISRKYLKKYRSRTFAHNKKKGNSLLKRHSAKYLTAKELFNMTKLKRIKNSYKKTKKIKLSKEVKDRMKIINYINRQYKKIAHPHKIKTLVNEFKLRMKEENASIPIEGKKNKFYFKQKKGHNFPIYYAKVGCDDVEVLNLEALSKGHDFFSVQDINLSYDEKYIAFSIDFTGDRLCKLFLKPTFSNDYKEIYVNKKTTPIANTHNMLSYSTINSGNCVWCCDSKLIYYITYDKAIRPCKLYAYNIETNKHSFIYEEKDKNCSLGISDVESNDHVVLYSTTYNGCKIFIVTDLFAKCVYTLKKDVDYLLSHIHSTWIVFKKYNHKAKIFLTNDFKSEKNCVISKPYQQFEYMHIQGDYILIFYKSKGFNKIMAYNYCTKQMSRHSIKLCEKNSGCTFNMPYFNNLNPYVNHCYINSQSFLMPTNGYFVDLSSMTIKKAYEQKVRSYNYKQYNEKVLYVTKDLHIIMMYKKGDGLTNKKCVLWGYGSYGVTRDPEFDIYIPSLLDRGFIFCIGYVRGGGRHGQKWYNEGRLMNKMNTFTDFIDCAKYLIKHKYTSSKRLAIWGRSAGGLLIGATINMAPEICNLAILGVPFLDPVSVLLNEDNPLAVESRIEWGDPHIKKVKDYISQYSPQENISLNKSYPNIYIYSNLNDTLVPYMEPFNFYNKIKESCVFKSGTRDIHMQIKKKYGHSQSSKRYEKLSEMGEIYDIILKYII